MRSHARRLEKNAYLIDLIEANSDRLELLSKRAPGRCSAIVTFRHCRLAPAQLYQRLRERRITCA
jgi:hypothetical protein